ncbi:guanyl-specific ribonuclease [Mariniluteicoccus flavus]
MKNKKYAALLALALVAALIGVGWWLNRGTDAGQGSSATTSRATSSKGATRAPTRQSAPPATRGGATDPESGLPWIEPAALPKEAQDVLARIDRGGPYQYEKDGSTFGNLEGRLPKKARGFYKEYTVRTPGESDRGARRIVTGDNDKVFYWTADHYASFSRVRR